ncbi:MAG: DUF1080 domain-containing protein [Bacteroidota bacterium]
MTWITFIYLIASGTFANQISEEQKKFIGKYKKQKTIIRPEDAFINKDPEPTLNDGFVDLYNGKDFKGWVKYGGNMDYHAEPEWIRGTCVPKEKSAYLSTVKSDYKDFIFTVEIKWEVDGNSGIMFRSYTDHTKTTAKGPQAEMEGMGERKWSGGIYGQGVGGWLYPLWLDAHKEARKALNFQNWNRLTIKAVGNLFQTWVNGVPCAKYTDEEDKFAQGFFSLQIHSGTKGEVLFRSPRVKEL